MIGHGGFQNQVIARAMKTGCVEVRALEMSVANVAVKAPPSARYPIDNPRPGGGRDVRLGRIRAELASREWRISMRESVDL
jgi:hypothetical protein